MQNWDRWCRTHPGVAFMVGNGLAGVVGGTIVLVSDGRVVPHGWSCLVIACGIVLLAAAALELLEIETTVDRATLVAAGVVVLLSTLTAVYFTHPAEDLPRLLLGHDADSQHLQVVHGAASAVAACIALRITYGLASPRRHRTHP